MLARVTREQEAARIIPLPPFMKLFHFHDLMDIRFFAVQQIRDFDPFIPAIERNHHILPIVQFKRMIIPDKELIACFIALRQNFVIAAVITICPEFLKKPHCSSIISVRGLRQRRQHKQTHHHCRHCYHARMPSRVHRKSSVIVGQRGCRRQKNLTRRLPLRYAETDLSPCRACDAARSYV